MSNTVESRAAAAATRLQRIQIPSDMGDIERAAATADPAFAARFEQLIGDAHRVAAADLERARVEARHRLGAALPSGLDNARDVVAVFAAAGAAAFFLARSRFDPEDVWPASLALLALATIGVIVLGGASSKRRPPAAYHRIIGVLVLVCGIVCAAGFALSGLVWQAIAASVAAVIVVIVLVRMVVLRGIDQSATARADAARKETADHAARLVADHRARTAAAVVAIVEQLPPGTHAEVLAARASALETLRAAGRLDAEAAARLAQTSFGTFVLDSWQGFLLRRYAGQRQQRAG